MYSTFNENVKKSLKFVYVALAILSIVGITVMVLSSVAVHEVTPLLDQDINDFLIDGVLYVDGSIETDSVTLYNANTRDLAKSGIETLPWTVMARYSYEFHFDPFIATDDGLGLIVYFNKNDLVTHISISPWSGQCMNSTKLVTSERIPDEFIPKSSFKVNAIFDSVTNNNDHNAGIVLIEDGKLSFQADLTDKNTLWYDSCEISYVSITFPTL